MKVPEIKFISSYLEWFYLDSFANCFQYSTALTIILIWKIDVFAVPYHLQKPNGESGNTFWLMVQIFFRVGMKLIL